MIDSYMSSGPAKALWRVLTLASQSQRDAANDVRIGADVGI